MFKKIRNYFIQHGQAFSLSLERLWNNPLINLMTIAVIAIALALPASMYIVLQNVKAVSRGWDNSAQISLFLKMNTSKAEVDALVTQLQNNPEISKVEYVAPEQGLQQFSKQSGFGDALKQLNTNPLPGVLIVQPAVDIVNSPEAVNQLTQHLKQLTQVDVAQLDMEWIKRLFGIIDLGQRGVWSLAVLLAVAVALIIGNTIRLSIQNSRREIEVIKLVGATDGFIRRPFLYTGLIYGFFGAALAYLIVNVILEWISAPIANLSALYQSNFVLVGFNTSSTELLMIFGILLGLASSWLAVSRQLRKIEPE